MVQTGPKIKLGGEKKGLVKVAYQVGIAEKVKTDPIIPAPSQSKMENISLGQFLTLGILVYQLPHQTSLLVNIFN